MNTIRLRKLTSLLCLVLMLCASQCTALPKQKAHDLTADQQAFSAAYIAGWNDAQANPGGTENNPYRYDTSSSSELLQDAYHSGWQSGQINGSNDPTTSIYYPADAGSDEGPNTPLPATAAQISNMVALSQSMAMYTQDIESYQAVQANESRYILGVLILFGLIIIFLLAAVNNKHGE